MKTFWVLIAGFTSKIEARVLGSRMVRIVNYALTARSLNDWRCHGVFDNEAPFV